MDDADHLSTAAQRIAGQVRRAARTGHANWSERFSFPFLFSSHFLSLHQSRTSSISSKVTIPTNDVQHNTRFRKIRVGRCIFFSSVLERAQRQTRLQYGAYLKANASGSLRMHRLTRPSLRVGAAGGRSGHRTTSPPSRSVALSVRAAARSALRSSLAERTKQILVHLARCRS